MKTIMNEKKSKTFRLAFVTLVASREKKENEKEVREEKTKKKESKEKKKQKENKHNKRTKKQVPCNYRMKEVTTKNHHCEEVATNASIMKKNQPPRSIELQQKEKKDRKR